MKTFITITLLITCSICMGQSIAVRPNGDTVILNSNGTWNEWKKESEEVDPVTPTKTSTTTCKYSKDETDEFTNVRSLITEKTQITTYKTGAKGVRPYFFVGAFTMPEGYTIYALYVNAYQELGCMSSESYVTLLFTDGTSLKIDYIGEIDCGNPFTFYGLISDNLEELKTKQVSKIRFHGDTSMDFIVETTDYFINAVTCIDP